MRKLPTFTCYCPKKRLNRLNVVQFTQCFVLTSIEYSHAETDLPMLWVMDQRERAKVSNRFNTLTEIKVRPFNLRASQSRPLPADSFTQGVF